MWDFSLLKLQPKDYFTLQKYSLNSNAVNTSRLTCWICWTFFQIACKVQNAKVVYCWSNFRFSESKYVNTSIDQSAHLLFGGRFKIYVRRLSKILQDQSQSQNWKLKDLGNCGFEILTDENSEIDWIVTSLPISTFTLKDLKKIFQFVFVFKVINKMIDLRKLQDLFLELRRDWCRK